MATLIKKAFNWGFRGCVHYHHDGYHDGVQADVVLELRMLHLAGNRKSTGCHTRGNLSTRDLKAGPHGDIHPPTRPPLLIEPLPLAAIFFQTITHGYWDQNSSKLLLDVVHSWM